jgi:hypothetical protein
MFCTFVIWQHIWYTVNSFFCRVRNMRSKFRYVLRLNGFEIGMVEIGEVKCGPLPNEELHFFSHSSLFLFKNEMEAYICCGPSIA